MLAAKSFEPTSDMAALERWVTILAEELAERITADNKLFNRRPKSLHLHYRSFIHNPHAVEHSICNGLLCAMGGPSALFDVATTAHFLNHNARVGLYFIR